MEFDVFQNTELFPVACVPLHLKGRNEILLSRSVMGITHLRKEVPTSLAPGNVVH